MNTNGGARAGAGRPSAADARLQAGLDDFSALLGMLTARLRLLRTDPGNDPTTGELRAMAHKANDPAHNSRAA